MVNVRIHHNGFVTTFRDTQQVINHTQGENFHFPPVSVKLFSHLDAFSPNCINLVATKYWSEKFPLCDAIEYAFSVCFPNWGFDHNFHMLVYSVKECQIIVSDTTIIQVVQALL